MHADVLMKKDGQNNISRSTQRFVALTTKEVSKPRTVDALSLGLCRPSIRELARLTRVDVRERAPADSERS